jgi:hypothetical protein
LNDPFASEFAIVRHFTKMSPSDQIQDSAEWQPPGETPQSRTSAIAPIGVSANHLRRVARTPFRGRLKEVLESDKLQITAEDSLLGFILDLGRDYFYLIGNVRSEYLSVSAIDRLLTEISRGEIENEIAVEGRLHVWSSLCRRLRLPVDPPSIPESRFHLKRFALGRSRPFDGILAWLSRVCGGNVHTQGIVSITASSTTWKFQVGINVIKSWIAIGLIIGVPAMSAIRGFNSISKVEGFQ